MKPSKVIFVLLISAFAVGDLALLTYVISAHKLWPDIPGVILLGLAFGQTMLLAAWFVFARQNVVLRVLIVFPAALGLSRVAAGATDGGSNVVTPWFAIQLVAFCAAMIPMSAARSLGVQIISKDDRRVATRPISQFSIWGLLSGTTAVAIALGAARHINMPLLGFGEAVAFFTCLAATGLVVFFVSMGIRTPEVAAMVTIPVVGLMCPFCGMLMAASGLPPRRDPPQWMLFGFCYGATIAMSVLALRIAGYGLLRRGTAPPAAKGGDEERDQIGVRSVDMEEIRIRIREK